jgi:hypothetical protein
MRYLYYCNSAFQLINVLNLHWHRKYAGFENIEDYSADVIILKAFYGAERLAEITEEKGFFDRVYVIGKAEHNSGALHLFKSFADIAFPKNYLKQKYDLDPRDMKYDVLTVPKFSPVTAAIWQINRNARMQLYEEGLASYCYDLDLIVPRSRSYKFLYKRLNHGKDFLDFEALYLVAPELFIKDCGDRIRKIPPYDQRHLQDVKEAFGEFAGYEDEKEKKLLWFSQTMFDDSEMLEILSEYKDDVLFCPHPRYPVESDRFMVARKNQIWEIKALNIDDIDDICILSVNSTSLFNPKLLFDEEPYVIFTYKLVKLFFSWTFFDETMQRFKKLYSDPDKVMIPETVEEFRDCLKRTAEKIRKDRDE